MLDECGWVDILYWWVGVVGGIFWVGEGLDIFYGWVGVGGSIFWVGGVVWININKH